MKSGQGITCIKEGGELIDTVDVSGRRNLTTRNIDHPVTGINSNCLESIRHNHFSLEHDSVLHIIVSQLNLYSFLTISSFVCYSWYLKMFLFRPLKAWSSLWQFLVATGARLFFPLGFAISSVLGRFYQSRIVDEESRGVSLLSQAC